MTTDVASPDAGADHRPAANPHPAANEQAAAQTAKAQFTTPGPRENLPDLPLLEFTHLWLSNPAEAESLVLAWRRLADVALEPNAFFEPWFLLPAWRHLAEAGGVELLAIEAPKRVFPAGPKVLCGLLPVVRRRTLHGLPLRCWEVWRHDYCFLGTPLVRQDCAAEVLDYLFRMAREGVASESPSAATIQLGMISGDGPWQRLLIESNRKQSRSVFVRDQHSRAQFERCADAETFLKTHLSRKKRHEIQRVERRLSEQGRLVTSWLSASQPAAAWADDFLQLEASGWKGRNSTALASQPSHAAFFRDMVERGNAEGRLLFGRLDFDDQPIAMICNLLAADGGYSFKIAYDERFAQHSPGLLIELALIRQLHERGIAWVDSCAAADHPMINHLWPGSALRQSLLVSSGSLWGELATALMPLMRFAKHAIRRRSGPPSPSV